MFKKLLTAVTLGTLVQFAAAKSASAQPPVLAEPQKVPSTYNHAFIPGGFDSNDQVEFVLSGKFSSLCWRPADVSVTVDHDAKTIQVGPYGYYYPGRLCATMVTDFNPTVNAGLLKVGTYKIIQQTNAQELGSVSIKAATTESPDDYLYAPIKQAFFESAVQGGKLSLAGDFPNSCMRFENIRLNVQKDVIVVQPIVVLDQKPGCTTGSFPFNKSVQFKNVPRGQYLIHIRSMNAHSVNTIVDVK